MTPPQPPASGQDRPTGPAAPEAADALPAPTVPPVGPAIPDHDPFLDTDAMPEVPEDGMPRRQGTGGFAGLNATGATHTSPAERHAAHLGPLAPPLGPPAGPPVAPPAGQAVDLDRPTEPPWAAAGAPPTVFAAEPAAPSVPAAPPSPPAPPAGPAVAAAAPGGPAPSPSPAPDLGPATSPAGRVDPAAISPLSPPASLRPPRRRPSTTLIALGGVTAALLLVSGVLAGMLLARGGNDESTSEAAAGAPATSVPAPTATSRLPRTTTTERVPAPTTSSVPRTSIAPPSTAVAPTSTAPGTQADPNALVADFTWSPDPVVAGQTFILQDQSTGQPTRRIWTWNGNRVSSTKAKSLSTSISAPTEITLTVCRSVDDSDCVAVTKSVPVG